MLRKAPFGEVTYTEPQVARKKEVSPCVCVCGGGRSVEVSPGRGQNLWGAWRGRSLVIRGRQEAHEALQNPLEGLGLGQGASPGALEPGPLTDLVGVSQTRHLWPGCPPAQPLGKGRERHWDSFQA